MFLIFFVMNAWPDATRTPYPLLQVRTTDSLPVGLFCPVTLKDYSRILLVCSEPRQKRFWNIDNGLLAVNHFFD